MPGISVTAANQALDGLTTPTNLLAFVNLAASDPGTTGAAESASTRQSCSWNAAATRAKTNSSALTFTGHAAGTAQTHFRTDSLVTAGVFGVSGALTSSVTATTITVAAGALSISA